MEFIRSVIVQDVTPPTAGTYAYDLPVNPLSHIILTIRCLNNLAEATLDHVLGLITKVEVLHRGTGIISMSARDLYTLNCILYGKSQILANRIATDNAVRFLPLIIPMGRKIFNPDECFPATRKGEFQVQVTCVMTSGNADTLSLQIETVELLEADPKNHIKVSTLTQTPSAIGENDLELPIGNILLGVLCFGTNFPDGTDWMTTIDQVKFLVDNEEYGYSRANWESMKANLALRTGYFGDRSAGAGSDELVNYIILDFDPTGDGKFALDTKGKSSVKIRYVAGDTSPIRVLPIELVSVE